MALIKCPECGREISSLAPACIGCGCPMSEIQRILNDQNEVINKENEIAPSTLVEETKKAETNFLDSITDENRSFIISILNSLSLDYEEDTVFEAKETADDYSLILKNHTDVKARFSVLKEGFILFEYLNKQYTNDHLVVLKCDSQHKDKVLRIFDKIMRTYEPEIYERSEKEKGSTKDKHFYRIFPKIKQEMNDKYYSANEDEKQLCKSIKEFVLNILSLNAPKQLVSVTWASSYHTFFGHSLSWNTADGYKSTAIVYFYYKATKILEAVNNYTETNFREKAVTNTKYFLDSLYKQFDNKEEININSCKGITESVGLVPDSIVDEVLVYFRQFE